MIQKSRFIGRCYRVETEREAAARIDYLRKAEWEATHHCYAFCVGTGVPTTRSSDDGEPSGTAGAPILNVLIRMELSNTLCVVTRYFGGILLGAGGLVRAYTGAASGAVQASGTVWMRPANGYTCTLSYAQWAATEQAIRKLAEVTDVAYAALVTVTFWLDAAQAEQTLARIIDMTEGRVKPEPCGTRMRPERACKV